jgi:hypothetical protein
MLRNDDQAKAALRPHELAKVSRHGRLVMGDQDAAIACGEGEDFVVLEAGQTCCVAVLKSMAGTRLRTADTTIWFRSASA